MRLLIAFVFIAFGIAHLAGFLVYWKFIEIEGFPWRNDFFDGRYEVGDYGVWVVGILWLVAGLAFILAGILAVATNATWEIFTLITAVFSLGLTAACRPETKYGVVINIVIIVFLIQNFFTSAV